MMASLVFWFSLCAFSMLQTSWAALLMKNETDRMSLLTFKMEVTDPLQVFRTWNDSVHFCLWSGITCGRKHQRVTAINLPSLGLMGSLTAHLANLTFLRRIDLGNNSFHGEIPQEIGRLHRLRHLVLVNNSFEGFIPTNISNCLQLAYVNFRRNKLVGGIPTELGLLPKLQHLDLGFNFLGGLIPPSLGNLSSLIFLGLDSCSLEGTIPHEVGQLSQLKKLALTENQLHGEVPPSLYNLSSMQDFSIQLNNLTGELPHRADISFPQLYFFAVGGNQLTGTIPHWLLNASNLNYLFVNQNSFFGSIPADIGKLQWLVHLKTEENLLGGEGEDDLKFISSLTNCSILSKLGTSYNNLHGLLPVSIANLSAGLLEMALGGNQIYGALHPDIWKLVNLQKFGLESNLLTGPIPNTIGMMSRLEELNLHQNYLTGELSFLGNLTKLVALDLSSNHIHGFIPPSIGNCQRLWFLNLNNNSLTGTIPVSLAKCNTLQNLDLSINGLTHTIPTSLFAIPTLVRLYLDQNFLSGHLSEDIGKLKITLVVSLYKNQLSGPIPNSLGNCLALDQLYLHSNSFEGVIPLSLGDLKVIKEVDLSHNKLRGVIPDVFTKLVYLEYLNLSYNDLEGEVPKEGVFKNVSRIFLQGNQKVCGGILELHFPPCTKDVDDSHKRATKIKVIIIVLAVTGGILFIMALCVATIFCRRKMKPKTLPRSSSNNLHMKIISYRDIRNATDGFSSSNLIGSGSFGTVYKGILDSDQMIIAVKVLNLEQTGATKSFIAECEALRNIRHRNLVKILTVCSGYDLQGREFKALVFEFMANGTVESWLYPQSTIQSMDCPRYLNLKARLNVAIDVAHALDYLHCQCQTPVVHCDLKPNNILLDGDMVAHVSDFGLAKILFTTNGDDSHQHSCTSRLKGTIGYIPPEYGTGSEVTTQGDVFSYGVVLLEMLIGKKPTHEMFKDGMSISKYARMAFPEQVMQIVDPQLLSRPEEDGLEKFRDCLVSIMKVGIECTSEVPDNRINIETVKSELEHVRERLLGDEIAIIVAQTISLQ